MKKLTGISACIAMLILAVSISRCKKSDSTTTPPKLVQLKTSATLGNYLTDKDGHALYFFSNDVNGTVTCTGGCSAVWPSFNITGLTADQIGTGLNLADFGSVGGQVTYKGWPLYTYSPTGNSTPEAPGGTLGENVGGIWFVAKPDYTIMLANTQLIGNDAKHYTSTYTVGDGSTIYFTDSKGNTLYVFKKDSANLNKFTKADFSNNVTFPIYDTTAIVVPSALDKTLFTNTTVFGHHQLSYKGWPLYYFGADSTIRGRNKGITVGGIGTVWPVGVKDIIAAPHQ